MENYINKFNSNDSVTLRNNKTQNSVTLQYINSVVNRVLPNIVYNIDKLKLDNSKKIRSYFKSNRKLQEYPNLYNEFKRVGFNMELCDLIRLQNLRVESEFIKSISLFVRFVTNKKHKRQTLNEFDLQIVNREFSSICPSGVGFRFPTFDELVYAMNKSASIGLPNPFIKKREVLDQLKSIYKKLIHCELKPSEVFSYPAAAFLRLQIKSSGLKFRLVQAVEVTQQFIESFFLLTLKSMLADHPLTSSYCVGRTMSEISSIISSGKQYYVYGFDYTKWDMRRQQDVSVCSFSLWSNRAGFSPYFEKIYNQCRNYYLTLPIYHPKFACNMRYLGTVSGSGFTTHDNTTCNWITMIVAINIYCKRNKLQYNRNDFKIYCNGDDVLLFSKHDLNVSILQDIIKRKFYCELELESSSKPGEDFAIFLGHTWIDGVPYKDEKHMVASVVFGSGNFPKMSTNELLQSRFFEIFGNVGNCSKYWKRFNRPILKRLYFFRELVSTHRFDTKSRLTNYANDSGTYLNRRGFWINFSNHSPLTIDTLWKDR